LHEHLQGTEGRSGGERHYDVRGMRSEGSQQADLHDCLPTLPDPRRGYANPCRDPRYRFSHETLGLIMSLISNKEQKQKTPKKHKKTQNTKTKKNKTKNQYKNKTKNKKLKNIFYVFKN
jgi:hypothetical protein